MCEKVPLTLQAAVAQVRAPSGDIWSKKTATASSRAWIKPYKRLAATLPLSRSKICSTGLRCEQYFGKQ